MPTIKELKDRRKQIYEKMEENSLLILYAGNAPFKDNNLKYEFSVNKNFYYLTGIDEEDAIFLAIKKDDEVHEELFIQGENNAILKFVGKVLNFEEARKISGIDDVFASNTHDFELSSYINGEKNSTEKIKIIYMDVNDNFGIGGSRTTSTIKDALEINYGIHVYNISNEITRLRCIKGNNEILLMSEATRKLDLGFKKLLSVLKVGEKESELQKVFTHFEEDLRVDSIYRKPVVSTGEHTLSFVNKFPDLKIEDGGFVIIDAAIKEERYVSSVARCYPVNGKFSKEQKTVYEVLLKTIDHALQIIKPGEQLSKINKDLFNFAAETALNLKIFRNKEAVDTSITRNIVEQIGLEEVSPFLIGSKLEEGYVLTVTPALFLNEKNFGMWIRDMIVVTSEGCYLLSGNVLREVKDIERAMASRG